MKQVKSSAEVDYTDSCKEIIRSIGFPEVDDNLMATYGDITIDFSSINPALYSIHALSEMYTYGKLAGIRIVQNQIKTVLGI